MFSSVFCMDRGLQIARVQLSAGARCRTLTRLESSSEAGKQACSRVDPGDFCSVRSIELRLMQVNGQSNKISATLTSSARTTYRYKWSKQLSGHLTMPCRATRIVRVNLPFKRSHTLDHMSFDGYVCRSRVNQYGHNVNIFCEYCIKFRCIQD